MSFTTLGLCDPILKAIKEQGYTTPTPVQLQAIPVILEKRDILAGAQTGTGKTAGFTLPLLELLTHRTKQNKKHQISALILTPTRELAAQVAQSVQMYGKYLPFKSTVIFGGVGINPQKAVLKKRCRYSYSNSWKIARSYFSRCVRYISSSNTSA